MADAFIEALRQAALEGTIARLPGTPASQTDAAPAEVSAPEELPPPCLLLVTPRTAWFSQVQRELFQLNPIWLSCQATEPAQALTLLPRGTFAAVVLDAGLPGEAALLEHLAKEFPQTARIVLSAPGRGPAPSSTPGPAVLSLPLDSGAQQLTECLRRARQMEEWLAHPALKNLLTRTKRLPSLPRLYVQLSAELRSADASLEGVADLIRQEPVMAAKLLQVVNSAVFALAHAVVDPAEAVLHLGFERTRALILTAGVFSQFDSPAAPGFSPEEAWNQSLRVGTWAREVARAQKPPAELVDAAFTAGLLHQVGQLILAANVPSLCATIKQVQANKKVTALEAELEVLCTTSAQLGACLLGTWGMPLNILEAVAWHPQPSRSADSSFSPLTAVHVATVFAHEARPASSPALPASGFDLAYLNGLGLTERIPRWREVCGLPAQEREP